MVDMERGLGELKYDIQNPEDREDLFKAMDEAFNFLESEVRDETVRGLLEDAGYDTEKLAELHQLKGHDPFVGADDLGMLYEWASWDMFVADRKDEGRITAAELVQNIWISFESVPRILATDYNSGEAFPLMINRISFKSERDIDRYLVGIAEVARLFQFEPRYRLLTNSFNFLMEQLRGNLHLLTHAYHHDAFREILAEDVTRKTTLFTLFEHFEPRGNLVKNVRMFNRLTKGFDEEPGSSRTAVTNYFLLAKGLQLGNDTFLENSRKKILGAVFALRNLKASHQAFVENESDLLQAYLRGHPYSELCSIFAELKGDVDLEHSSFKAFANTFPDYSADIARAWVWLAKKYGKAVPAEFDVEVDELVDPFQEEGDIAKLEDIYLVAIDELEAGHIMHQFLGAEDFIVAETSAINSASDLGVDGARAIFDQTSSRNHLLEAGFREKDLGVYHALYATTVSGVLDRQDLSDYFCTVRDQDLSGYVLGDFLTAYIGHSEFKNTFEGVLSEDDKNIEYLCSAFRNNATNSIGHFAMHLLGEIVFKKNDRRRIEMVLTEIFDESTYSNAPSCTPLFAFLAYVPKLDQAMLDFVTECLLKKAFLWQPERIDFVGNDFKGSGFSFVPAIFPFQLLDMFGYENVIRVAQKMVDPKGHSEELGAVIEDYDWDDGEMEAKFEEIKKGTFSPMRIYDGVYVDLGDEIQAKLYPIRKKHDPGFWNMDLRRCRIFEDGPRVERMRFRFADGEVYARDHDDQISKDLLAKVRGLGIDLAHKALTRQQARKTEKDQKRLERNFVAAGDGAPEKVIKEEIKEALKPLLVTTEKPSTIDFTEPVQIAYAGRKKEVKSVLSENEKRVAALLKGASLREIDDEVIVFKRIDDGESVPQYRQLSKVEVAAQIENGTFASPDENLLIPIEPHYARKTGVQERRPGRTKANPNVWAVAQNTQSSEDRRAFESHLDWGLPKVSDVVPRSGALLRVKEPLGVQYENGIDIADLIAITKGVPRMDGSPSWEKDGQQVDFGEEYRAAQATAFDRDISACELRIAELQSIELRSFIADKREALMQEIIRLRAREIEVRELVEIDKNDSNQLEKVDDKVLKARAEMFKEMLLVIAERLGDLSESAGEDAVVSELGAELMYFNLLNQIPQSIQTRADLEAFVAQKEAEREAVLSEVNDEFREAQELLRDEAGNIYEDYFVPLYREKVQPLDRDLEDVKFLFEAFDYCEQLRQEQIAGFEDERQKLVAEKAMVLEQLEQMFTQSQICSYTYTDKETQERRTKTWGEIRLPWETNMSFVNPQVKAVATLAAELEVAGVDTV